MRQDFNKNEKTKKTKSEKLKVKSEKLKVSKKTNQ
ncbi:hypothetical protein IMCC3317_37410 [Kordia antarctica]|uniref:Uncharacterized protein n=1 Tax=Kordia antarctica TaxID=1218801 RepID=A0A7L4ZPE1_9FLAO|nr:hypothetical protein IMCC3317_37410 [Kordia antarctica]